MQSRSTACCRRTQPCLVSDWRQRVERREVKRKTNLVGDRHTALAACRLDVGLHHHRSVKREGSRSAGSAGASRTSARRRVPQSHAPHLPLAIDSASLELVEQLKERGVVAPLRVHPAGVGTCNAASLRGQIHRCEVSCRVSIARHGARVRTRAAVCRPNVALAAVAAGREAGWGASWGAAIAGGRLRQSRRDMCSCARAG